MNLYIHIPFCESKCKYCRFASLWWWINSKLKDFYLKYLLNDIKKNKVLNKTLFLDTIYFWGWTPSLLSLNDFNKIFYELKNKTNFKKNIEITLEATPRTITKENLENWYKLWINRLSVWVQTLNNKALKEINRDDKKIIVNALNTLKNSKIKNISLDFIIWLPFVKKWEVFKDINFILNNFSFVKHLSIYMLEDYYFTWKESLQNSKFESIFYPSDWKQLWIDEEDYIDEYLQIKYFLEEVWFKRYEISNFSKPWYECKHNKWYWKHKEYLWFWLWAHSFIWNKRYAYKDDFISYYKGVLDYEEVLTEEDIFLEKLMFLLRTTWIRKNLIKKLDSKKINFLVENWLLEYNKNLLKIRDDKIHLLDGIIKELL